MTLIAEGVTLITEGVTLITEEVTLITEEVNKTTGAVKKDSGRCKVKNRPVIATTFILTLLVSQNKSLFLNRIKKSDSFS